jgi:acyl carrier protein
MKERVLKVLEELRPDLDFEGQTKLIDDGVLDSFDIVTLVFELNEEFSINIAVEELVPDNFNSVDAMVELVNSKL